MREDILARDLTDVAYVTRNGCKVKSGVLNDPYTGKVIHFTRGQNTSAAVQIDHVVALQNAWQSGAKDWNARKRMQFANDPYNLLAVDGPANQGKGSASAAYWLPTNASYRCDYVARQIGERQIRTLGDEQREACDAKCAAWMPGAGDSRRLSALRTNFAWLQLPPKT